MKIIEDIQHHLVHYFVLAVILNFGIGMFWFWRFAPLYQALVVVITSGAYVAWGILHHWLEDDLHLKVFFEYLLVAILIDFILLSLLLRA